MSLALAMSPGRYACVLWGLLLGIILAQDACSRTARGKSDSIGTSPTDAGTGDPDGGGISRDPDASVPMDGGENESDAGQTSDAGEVDGGSDAGSSDAGSCPPTQVSDAGPPDGGLIWLPAVPATVSPNQEAAWTGSSTDEECQAISPGAVPQQLSLGSDGGWCYTAVVAGQGNLAALSAFPTTTSLIHSDGLGAAAIAETRSELELNVAPRGDGWLLLSHATSVGYFLRSIDFDGNAGLPIPTDVNDRLVPNPAGGYVESRVEVISCNQIPPTYALQLRWADPSLQPLEDWQTAITWTGENNDSQIVVDTEGRALVLSFLYPPSFGGRSQPQSWTFKARWLGPTGPLSDAFEPVAPIHTPSSTGGSPLFAGWGTLLQLREGGFAAFHSPSNDSGSISPSGWYALYPSGLSQVATPPSWLGQYDGSIALLAGGIGYASTIRDPSTCTRSAQLIAPSGRLCFSVPLDSSDLCGAWADTFWPDGTLVIQNNCDLRWWPHLGGLQATGPQ